MPISRRKALAAAGLAGLGFVLPVSAEASAEPGTKVTARGNPLFPGLGVCDPQVRVYSDRVYLYATHDASADSTHFVMHDWWVWHSDDMLRWELVSVLKPEETYFRRPSSNCWATDAARRNGKYYFYFSMGSRNIGVVEGPTPAGPWRDPLGHALIADGLVPTQARDPGIFQEPDGSSYIVFGTFDYYLARLNDDMISLAETPRRIHIENPEGPYGKGRTDDKPFLHRRGGQYYLSWGCYYAVSDSLHGPYECRGSILRADRMAPEFLDTRNRTGPRAPSPQSAPADWIGYDRHGSFFELYGQWYFICNDQSLPGSTTFFRNSVISSVRYKRNGDIDPVRLTPTGVGQYDARVGIEATDFFKGVKAEVAEDAEGRFQVRGLTAGGSLVYPQVRNLSPQLVMVVSATSVQMESSVEMEIRRGDPNGALLGRLTLKPSEAAGRDAIFSIGLQGVRSTEDLCVVFRGGPGELLRLNRIDFR